MVSLILSNPNSVHQSSMGDQNSLSKPLLTPPTVLRSPRNDAVSGPPSRGIVFRLLFLSSVALLALWASREASKGFQVSIVNALPRGSPAGQRFDLFYVSDDKATRVLLNASDFVESLLYGGGPPDGRPKKPVSRVTLRLAAGRLPGGVSVKSDGGESDGFVVDLSHELMGAPDVDGAVKSAVLRGMARVWLWGEESGAPEEILSGAVEYIVAAGGFGGGGDLEPMMMMMMTRCDDHRPDWYAGKDPRFVGRVLGRCEERERGFIGRLNRAMRDPWHDPTVDDALGKPAQLCLCVPDD